jgi:hypothetical protein
MARFLNPSLPTRILWKNFKSVGAAEDKLDYVLVLFSPDELNSFYSLDEPVEHAGTGTPTLTSYQSSIFAFQMYLSLLLKELFRQ